MGDKQARLQFLLIMILYGTIGTLSRFIDMPSSIICLGRAALAVFMITLILAARKEAPCKPAIRRNARWLLLSSCLMCLNWICQFEAFKYTTIATSTLCYYMQPVFYILSAAIVLKETLSARKLACVAAAFAGMILVSGVLQTGFHISELKGAIYGVAGGFFYAMVVLVNKYMKDIEPIDTTLVQMALVTVIMIPYSALTGAFGEAHLTAKGLVCLAILGLFYTGVGYIIYFDSVNRLSAQTVGIMSYIDPVVAILLSAFFLREPVTVYTVTGAVLILGATAVSELGDLKRHDMVE